MANDYAPPTYDEVQAALSYIPTPATHNEWYPIAIAIKDALGENGFTLWDEWSRQGKGYNSSVAKSTWKSATPKPGGITAATLFRLARDNGYRPERPYVPPTPEQMAAREAEQRARDEAAARELAETRRLAARKAYGIWKNADKTVDLNHAYLQRKGIAEAELVRGIRQNEYQGQRQLVIPLYQGGELVSVQTINEAGGKHFLKGGEKSGSYAVLGNLEREAHKGIVLAEGFATAASIRKATGAPVVIAFDSGNMIRIAENMATRLPETQRVILAADNDPSGTGLAAASQAAVILGGRARIALPDFSPETVARFQAEHGAWDEKRARENLPTDFNDLHLTAGIEAVRAQMAAALPMMKKQPETVTASSTDLEWEQTVADQRRLDSERHAERAPWRDFPPVIRNGGLGSLKNEPEYAAAKGGNDIEAGRLVNKLLKEETVQQFREMIGDRKPVIVSVSATESAGRNKIPLAMAQALGSRLDLPVDTDIQQINKVSRTGSGIDHRFVFQPVFDGRVEAGRDYLIVDDTLAVGGTVAALRGYIENRGGHVVGAGVMTAHKGALNLPVKQAMIDNISRKHGNTMDNYWKEEFGYGIDQLTQGEAGHLNAARDVEQIRDRIAEARLQGIARPTEQTLSLSPGQQERPDGIDPSLTQAAAPDAAAFSMPVQNGRQEEQETKNMTQQTDNHPVYSSDNPYAPYAAYDAEVRQNADDWEARIPLTETMLAGFNRQAEQQGYVTYIEAHHASLGRFQAEKELDGRTAVIDGEFKNHGGASVYEAPRDFTVTMKQNGEEQDYFYTNSLNAALAQAETYLKEQDKSITENSMPNQPEPASPAETQTSAPKPEAAVSISAPAQGQSMVQQPEKQPETAQTATAAPIPEAVGETKEENGIEYGGSRTQDAVRSELETITVAEVQENLRRIRTADRRAAAASEAAQETQAQPTREQTSENAHGTPADLSREARADTGRPSEKTSAEMQHEKRTQPKPVLDLNYETAAGLDARYVRYDGRYLDPNNARTVLFEDKGAKIKTAREDAQTISDMLDTAQAKNWDNIRISGSREFKRQMWLEAELRGIPNSGYSPSKEDLAMRDQMRAARERNSIEAGGINRTAEPSAHNPPPRQPENRQSAHSPSEQLVADDSVRLKSEAANLQTRAETPAQTQAANRAAETAVQAADEQQSVPKPDSGRTADKSQDPSSPNHALEAARAAYLSKADRLSKAAKEQLANHERDFAEAVKGIPESKHESAMLNFYTGMQKRMSGTKLDMPEPTATAERSQTQQPRQPSVQPKRRDDGMDMDR
jgi:protein traN